PIRSEVEPTRQACSRKRRRELESKWSSCGPSTTRTTTREAGACPAASAPGSGAEDPPRANASPARRARPPSPPNPAPTSVARQPSTSGTSLPPRTGGGHAEAAMAGAAAGLDRREQTGLDHLDRRVEGRGSFRPCRLGRRQLADGHEPHAVAGGDEGGWLGRGVEQPPRGPADQVP